MLTTTINFFIALFLFLLLNIDGANCFVYYGANCFVSIRQRRHLQLIQQYKSSSLHLKVDTKQEQQQQTIESDTNIIDECVFQDIEVGCVDELIKEDGGSSEVAMSSTTGWSYGEFAKTYPNVNNIGIATIKTASADLLAQVAIANTPIS